MARQQFGWVQDNKGVEEVLLDKGVGGCRLWTGEDDKELGANESHGDLTIVLLDMVLALLPHWRRNAQGIGDCVSWGWELAVLIAICADIIQRREPWKFPGEVATEPIYGGSRVEARGRRSGGWIDGSYGATAAKWVLKWGILHRINYALRTGDGEHDLSRYSSKKAKNWGNYGCGGSGHDGKILDDVAAERPVKEAPQVTSFEQLVACVKSGYPVAVCSGQGLSKRGSDGFARAWGRWAHCMAFTGITLGKKDGALCTNSWGNSWGTKAPLPGVTSDAIKKCSAWVDAKTVNSMLRLGDSFAVTGVEGLVRRKIDWEEIWHVGGRH